jgi:hypothetical protein
MVYAKRHVLGRLVAMNPFIPPHISIRFRFVFRSQTSHLSRGFSSLLCSYPCNLLTFSTLLQSLLVAGFPTIHNNEPRSTTPGQPLQCRVLPQQTSAIGLNTFTISWPQGEYRSSPTNHLGCDHNDVLAISADPTPSPSASQQDNLPVIIAALAGGGALLTVSVLVAFLLIRRKHKRKVFLRGRPSKISPGLGGSRGGTPLHYASNIMTTVSRPSLSKSNQPPPQILRPAAPLQEGATTSKPARPIGIHERYPSPYTALALEKAYEILERNVTSPIPSYISGQSDGAGSRVASPQPSSDLNHGRSLRSLDQSPPISTSRLPFSQATFDAPNSERRGTSRPGTSGSTRSRNPTGGEQPRPTVRRPSEVRRSELLAALWSTDVVAVVRQPGLPSRPSTAVSRPSTGSDAATVARDRHRPP